jgi:hypothetical protein
MRIASEFSSLPKRDRLRALFNYGRLIVGIARYLEEAQGRAFPDMAESFKKTSWHLTNSICDIEKPAPKANFFQTSSLKQLMAQFAVNAERNMTLRAMCQLRTNHHNVKGAEPEEPDSDRRESLLWLSH